MLRWLWQHLLLRTSIPNVSRERIRIVPKRRLIIFLEYPPYLQFLHWIVSFWVEFVYLRHPIFVSLINPIRKTSSTASIFGLLSCSLHYLNCHRQILIVVRFFLVHANNSWFDWESSLEEVSRSLTICPSWATFRRWFVLIPKSLLCLDDNLPLSFGKFCSLYLWLKLHYPSLPALLGPSRAHFFSDLFWSWAFEESMGDK